VSLCRECAENAGTGHHGIISTGIEAVRCFHFVASCKEGEGGTKILVGPALQCEGIGLTQGGEVKLWLLPKNVSYMLIDSFLRHGVDARLNTHAYESSALGTD
jgi:hypothetical protein